MNANSRDGWGQTPLLLAVRGGHEAIVELLLATGKIDANAKDNNGTTPLLLASSRDHRAIVKLLFRL